MSRSLILVTIITLLCLGCSNESTPVDTTDDVAREYKPGKVNGDISASNLTFNIAVYERTCLPLLELAMSISKPKSSAEDYADLEQQLYENYKKANRLDNPLDVRYAGLEAAISQCNSLAEYINRQIK